MENFDLHIHSTCSDGEKSVSEILEYAEGNNFEFISITDHDNIDCINEIRKNNLGKVKCIPGVELSVSYKEYDIHVLYYGFKKTKELKKIIDYQQKVRLHKMENYIKQLKLKYNIEFPKDQVNEILTKKNVGKNDIARLLVNNGFVSDRKEGFDKYIIKLIPSDMKKIDFDTVVKMAKKENGILILAHPYEILKEYSLEIKELYKIMDELVENGCDGIEAFHSNCTLKECNTLYEYALNKGILISAGSDFHRNEQKPNDGIGFLYNTISKKYKKIDKEKINFLKKVVDDELWIN